MRPCRLREVRVKTVQMASVQVVPPSGGGMRTLCGTPTYGPASLGRQGDRGCAATAPATPMRNDALRGVRPLDSCGPVDNVYGPGSNTESDRQAFDAVRPQGRARKMA